MPDYGSFDHGYDYTPTPIQNPQIPQVQYQSPVYNPAIHGTPSPYGNTPQINQITPAQQMVQQYQNMNTPTIGMANPRLVQLQNRMNEIGGGAKTAGQIAEWGSRGLGYLGGSLLGGFGGGLATAADLGGVFSGIGQRVQNAYSWASGDLDQQQQIMRQIQQEREVMQMQRMSQNFVFGGRFSNQSTGYSGWNLQSSRQMHGALGKLQNQEPGMDINQLFQTGLQTNVLRGQDPQQLARQMEGLVKNVKTFMLVAQNPDMQDAMKAMSELSRSGISMTTANMQQVLPQMQTLAKAAGTTMQGLMATSGAMGQQMFNQMRIPGQFGMMTGMQTQAMANQTAQLMPQWQLNMAGGVQGIQQGLMQGVATSQSVLQNNLSAFVEFGDENTMPTLNMDRLDDYLGGRISHKELRTLAKKGMGTGRQERYRRQQLLEQYAPQLMGAVQEQLGPEGNIEMIERTAQQLMSQKKGMNRHTALSTILGGRAKADAYIASQSASGQARRLQMQRATSIEQERLARFGQDKGWVSRYANVGGQLELQNIGGLSTEELKSGIQDVLTNKTSGFEFQGYEAFTPSGITPRTQVLEAWMGDRDDTEQSVSPVSQGALSDLVDVGAEQSASLGASILNNMSTAYWNKNLASEGSTLTNATTKATNYINRITNKQRQDRASRELRYFSNISKKATAYGKSDIKDVAAARADITQGLSNVATSSEVNDIQEMMVRSVGLEASYAGFVLGTGGQGKVDATRAMQRTISNIRKKYGGQKITVNGQQVDKAEAIISSLGKYETHMMGIALNRVSKTGTKKQQDAIANTQDLAGKYIDATSFTALKSQVEDSKREVAEMIGVELSDSALTESMGRMRRYGLEDEESIKMMQEYAAAELTHSQEGERSRIQDLAERGDKRAQGVIEAFNEIKGLSKEQKREQLAIIAGVTKEQADIAAGEGGGFSAESLKLKAKGGITGSSAKVRSHLQILASKQKRVESQTKAYQELANVLTQGSVESLEGAIQGSGGDIMKYLEEQATTKTSQIGRDLTAAFPTVSQQLKEASEAQKRGDKEVYKQHMDAATAKLNEKLSGRIEASKSGSYKATAKGKGAPVMGEFTKMVDNMSGAVTNLNTATEHLVKASGGLLPKRDKDN